MVLKIHIYNHPDKQTVELLSLINQKLDNLMAVTKEQYLNLISQINDSTNNIAADLESIKQQLADALAAGGLTAADEEEILGKLQEAADKLKTTADSTPDGQPTPPVENPQ